MIPTITVEDADHKHVDHVTNGVKPLHEEGSEQLPGAIPTQAADPIPHWYRVGWREMSGKDCMPLEGEAKDQSVLDLFISEQFYGDWYHNAGVIVFVCACHRRPVLNLTVSVVGCLSDAFSNQVQFWVGLVVHSTCLLQHLLHYINAAAQTLLTR
jgi:hypothetical protein